LPTKHPLAESAVGEKQYLLNTSEQSKFLDKVIWGTMGIWMYNTEQMAELLSHVLALSCEHISSLGFMVGYLCLFNTFVVLAQVIWANRS
jgi:hypothetical protein